GGDSGAEAAADVLRRNPINGIAGCCARAASGHAAAAAPSNDMNARRFSTRCLIVRYQSPEPGFGEKYWSLSALPSHSFQSGGGAFLTLIFGQIFAYSALSDSHFSSPASLSALMASTGHSGSHTPQSMHSSGWMTSMFSPS